jgi:hypothetical protein
MTAFRELEHGPLNAAPSLLAFWPGAILMPDETGISARKLMSTYAPAVSLNVLPRTQMFRG